MLEKRFSLLIWKIRVIEEHTCPPYSTPDVRVPPSQCSAPGWPKYKDQNILSLRVKEAQTALDFQDHRLIFFLKKEEKDRGKKKNTYQTRSNQEEG